MKRSLAALKKLSEIGFDGAAKKIRQKLWRRGEKRRERETYQKWIEINRISDDERAEMRRRIAEFSHQPLISVVLPIYNVEEKWLRLCVESVFAQLYENWELCIADDCSPAAHVKRVLSEYAAQDKRVKVVFRETNGHISAASNSALSLANGEFVALLDHDDELAEDALFWIVSEINRFPSAELIYTDEDMIDENGNRYEPKFKPDWSADFFLSLNLITHLAVYRRQTLEKIGGFQLGVEGSQDYDLTLRFVEQIEESNIRHVPKILYHWRAIPGSVALASDQKNYAHDAARRAIAAHLQRRGVVAEVTGGNFNYHRVRYAIPQPAPLVSVIIPAAPGDSVSQLLEQNFAHNSYQNFEIILAAPQNETSRVETLKQMFSDSRSRVETFDFVSRADLLNQAAGAARGEILCFLNADLLAVSDDWLTELISHAAREEIGAVGAKLLFLDDAIQHAGSIVGAGEVYCADANCFLPDDEPGNMARAAVINNFSAVSAACLAVWRAAFESVNGFDAANFPNKLFDADFCLRLAAERNLRSIFTPYAKLKWRITPKDFARLSIVATEAEKQNFKTRWQTIIGNDPFYNPNFSRENGNFALRIAR